MCLNAIIAANTFPDKVTEWRQSQPFGPVTIGELAVQYTWYSYPQHFIESSSYIPFLLDTHHLFVNARTLVCSKGIPQLGISKQAWMEVADGTGIPMNANNKLNPAMVVDLVDRQSNEIAQITFSADVENAMRNNGRIAEADFCRIIRDWYAAEDSSGMPAQERLRCRLAMRDFLLGTLDLSVFPPPGSHVSGITIVMFEGILTNIDRRIQLNTLVRGNTFNVRAPTSLDSENFFGAFQDLDPKGKGILMPDDIPKVMEAATYIYNTQMDNDR